MVYEQILYEVNGRVATITLNRPDKLNAWTARMEEEVGDALRAASADELAGAIVLTGAGRGFCAGADMSLLSDAVNRGGARAGLLAADVEASNGWRRDFHKKYAWLMTVPKPIIAAIHGPSVGLGFVIPLYCDFRVASPTARFSSIFAKRGLVAEYGMAWMLPRVVGLAGAIDLLFTARTIDGAEAHRMGLVHRLFPEEGFLEAAQGFARELATTVSPRSLRVMKRQLYEAQFQTLGEAFETALEEMASSLASEDFREGVAHYLEKRAPAFTGR